MTDALAGVVGAVVIGGIVVAYVRERRARTRPPEVLPAEPPEPLAATDEDTTTIRSSSPNWGMPIVYCLLLIGADTHRDSFWGVLWQAIFFVIVAVAAYSTFSPKELAQEQARQPGTTRMQHYVTFGVPYLLFPLAGWFLAMRMGWRLGVFVPALPWLLLLLFGLIVSVSHTTRE